MKARERRGMRSLECSRIVFFFGSTSIGKSFISLLGYFVRTKLLTLVRLRSVDNGSRLCRRRDLMRRTVFKFVELSLPPSLNRKIPQCLSSGVRLRLLGDWIIGGYQGDIASKNATTRAGPSKYPSEAKNSSILVTVAIKYGSSEQLVDDFGLHFEMQGAPRDSEQQSLFCDFGV